MDQLAAELRKRGARVIDGPVDRGYCQRELVVRDCNGLFPCFGQDCDPSDETHLSRRH